MDYPHDDTPKRWQRMIKGDDIVSKSSRVAKPAHNKKSSDNHHRDMVVPGETFNQYNQRLSVNKRQAENLAKLAEIDAAVKLEKQTIRPKRREHLAKRKKLLKARRQRRKQGDD